MKHPTPPPSTSLVVSRVAVHLLKAFILSVQDHLPDAALLLRVGHPARPGISAGLHSLQLWPGGLTEVTGSPYMNTHTHTYNCDSLLNDPRNPHPLAHTLPYIAIQHRTQPCNISDSFFALCSYSFYCWPKFLFLFPLKQAIKTSQQTHTVALFSRTPELQGVLKFFWL